MIFNTMDPVFQDYRDNIIVDKNNPVLAFKANRDRYTIGTNSEKYAGLSQIGSIYSEDALTWNVFRTLEVENSLHMLKDLLGELDNPKLLLWTLALSPNSYCEQFLVGQTIRNIDGKYRGQISEPDAIILTSDTIFVVECKLGHSNTYPSHLWETASPDGPRKRVEDYFNPSCNPFRPSIPSDLYMKEAYQLYRMAFYAYKLSKVFSVPNARFISITNKTWYTKNTSKRSPEDIWNDFSNEIEPLKLEVKNIFWQDIKTCIKPNNNTLLEDLQKYLTNHVSLK